MSKTNNKENNEVKNNEVTVNDIKIFLLSCFQKNDKRMDKKGVVKVGVESKNGVTHLFLDKTDIENQFKVSSKTHKKVNFEKSLLSAVDIQNLNNQKGVIVLSDVVGNGTNFYSTLIFKDSIIKINWDSKEISNNFNHNVLSDFYDMLSKFFNFEKLEVTEIEILGQTILITKNLKGDILKIKTNSKTITDKKDIETFMNFIS